VKEKTLEGRVCIVTGAATGIGLSISKNFYNHGAKVILWDKNESKLKDACSTFQDQSRVKNICIDITDSDSVSKSVDSSIETFKKIDVLVNNAGISGPILPTWDYPLDDWHKVIDINLNGLFYCCQSVIKRMIQNKYGRIINIASIEGKEGNPKAPAYSASKAAVIGLTKTLGKELADKGILVNCITPAAVKTDIFEQITEEHVQYMLSKIPMGRLGRVEEIAALVLWLASEDCSFSTAGVFDISGGRATY